MDHVRRLRPLAPIGIAYFIGAVASLFLARLHNGVPFLWIPASIMFVSLRVRPVREWAPVVFVCAVALFFASALFGGGWAMAVPMTLINMVEGVVGSFLLNRTRRFHSPLGTFGWLLELVVPIGLVSPAITAGMVWGISTLIGIDAHDVAIDLFCGHALGNLVFTPLNGVRAIRTELLQHGAGELAGLLLGVGTVAFFVFEQSQAPILFLVFVPMILLASRLGFSGSVIGLVIIAAIAGWCTAAGYGPVTLMHLDLDSQIRFIQFYLVAIVLTVLPVAADLKNRTELHQAMRISEARYRVLAEQSTDVLMHLDLDAKVRYISPSVKNLTGHDASDFFTGAALVAPDDIHLAKAGHRAVIEAAGETVNFEYRVMTSDGERRWVEAHARLIISVDGTIDGVMSVVRDISIRKETEQRLSHAALTDALTGLPNRRAFEEAAAVRVALDRPFSTDCIAIFDIDRFKRVNDTFGHDAGDSVLQTFATVLRGVVRQNDCIARLGGEEFAVMFPDTQIMQALTVCERLREEMALATTPVGANRVRVTVSGGVALLGPGGLEAALKQADQALYAAKRGGRDQMTLAA